MGRSVKGCQTAGKGRPWAAKRRGAMGKGSQAVGEGGGFLWKAEKGAMGEDKKAFKARSACLERLVRGDATGLVPTVGEC